MRNYNEFQEKIWKPFRAIFPDIKKVHIPPKLRDSKHISMNSLIGELNAMKLQMRPTSGNSIWYYLSTILGCFTLLAFFLFCCCRKRISKILKLINCKWTAKSRKWRLRLSSGPANPEEMEMVTMVPVYPGDDAPVSRDVAKAASASPKEEIPFTVKHLYPSIPANKVPDNS